MHFVSIHVVHPYSSMDLATAWKNNYPNLGLLIAYCVFGTGGGSTYATGLTWNFLTKILVNFHAQLTCTPQFTVFFVVFFLREKTIYYSSSIKQLKKRNELLNLKKLAVGCEEIYYISQLRR